MILAHLTWQEVRALDRETVTLIPTGSLEQHGPHLPLITDTLLVTAVAEAVEKRMADKVLLTPTLWLGASGHHLGFPGTLNASMTAYMESLKSVVGSLQRHGFRKFLVVNGHGGNCDPNGVALRELKEENHDLALAQRNYYDAGGDMAAHLSGPHKGIHHACEAETSLVMHLRPEWVRQDKLRVDGLKADPEIPGLVPMFDEITEEGFIGFATLATPEKGKAIFESCVSGLCQNVSAFSQNYVFVPWGW